MAINERSIQFFNKSVAVNTTDGTLVAAIPGAKIRLLSVVSVPAATPAATLAFNSKGSGSGTLISPAIPLTAATLLSLGNGNAGICETNKGEALTTTTGAGTNASFIYISYVVI